LTLTVYKGSSIWSRQESAMNAAAPSHRPYPFIPEDSRHGPHAYASSHWPFYVHARRSCTSSGPCILVYTRQILLSVSQLMCFPVSMQSVRARPIRTDIIEVKRTITSLLQQHYKRGTVTQQWTSRIVGRSSILNKVAENVRMLSALFHGWLLLQQRGCREPQVPAYRYPYVKCEYPHRYLH
jgi:hypothetical protein